MKYCRTGITCPAIFNSPYEFSHQTLIFFIYPFNAGGF
jgi:hypothetical protein